MRAIVLASVAVFAVGGATLVFAQQRPMGPDGGGRRPMISADDRAAFTDARIAALHAGLRLSADQEKNWGAFEQAYRDFATLRAQSMTQAPPPPAGDPIERMARRADALTKHGDAMKRLADAGAPLYGSLDDAQKRRFAMLSRLGGRGHGPAHWGRRGEGAPGGMMGPRRGEGPPIGQDRFGDGRRGGGPGREGFRGDRFGMERFGGERFGEEERFGMMTPRERSFGEDVDRGGPRERSDRWRQRSPDTPRRPLTEGEERL